MAIESVQIATNRYAGPQSDAINLYSYELASNLTLGQLVQAVCLRSAAVYEAQSVTKMNLMSAGSQKLDDAAGWLEKIADGTAVWADARNYLVGVMGISADSLPDSLEPTDSDNRCSYDKRMQAAKALQDKMNLLAQTQQEDMIDLQTLVNRRDVAYSTSSGVVRTMGQSMTQDAANFL